MRIRIPSHLISNAQPSSSHGERRRSPPSSVGAVRASPTTTLAWRESLARTGGAGHRRRKRHRARRAPDTSSGTGRRSRSWGAPKTGSAPRPTRSRADAPRAAPKVRWSAGDASSEDDIVAAVGSRRLKSTGALAARGRIGGHRDHGTGRRHVDVRVGARAQRQPHRHVPHHQARGAGARPRRWRIDRRHLVDRSASHASVHGAVLGVEGGHRDTRPQRRGRARSRRGARERGASRTRADRAGGSVRRRRAGAGRLPRADAARTGWARSTTSPPGCATSSDRSPRGSPARSSGSTVATPCAGARTSSTGHVRSMGTVWVCVDGRLRPSAVMIPVTAVSSGNSASTPCDRF